MLNTGTGTVTVIFNLEMRIFKVCVVENSSTINMINYFFLAAHSMLRKLEYTDFSFFFADSSSLTFEAGVPQNSVLRPHFSSCSVLKDHI